jgi:catechol 2,3-dioxygenase-like lactoylglutathione lyase family enzyme
MIDHLSIGVRDLDRAVQFYDAILGPLGYVRVLTHPGDVDHPFRSACYGPPGTDPVADPHLAPFWLEERPDPTDGGSGSHVSFGAPSRAAVEQFHAAGLAHGATDYGAPGLREHYGAGYYAAFLIDPWGWRIEAVTFGA